MAELRNAIKSIPLFDEKKIFKVHLQTFRQWLTIQDISHNADMKLALIYSIRGQAAERVRHLSTGTTIYNETPNYQDYENLVQEIFHPQAEQDLAKSEFLLRRQSAREDVGRYFSVKMALFMEAYGTAGPYSILLSEIIKGLYNPVVKRQLRRSSPRDPEELRTKLFAIVAAERIGVLEGYGESTSLDGLSAVSTAVENQRYTQTEEEEEKMDINLMGPSNKTKPMQRDGNKQCYRCGKFGHLIKNCRQKEPARQQNRAKQGNKGTTEGRKCYHCNRTGHVIADCIAKKKGKPKTLPGKVQQLEETTWGNLDEEQLINMLEKNGAIQMIQTEEKNAEVQKIQTEEENEEEQQIQTEVNKAKPLN